MAHASIEEIDQAVAGQTAPRALPRDASRANGDVVALRAMDGEQPGAWKEWTFAAVRRPRGPGRGRAPAVRRRSRATGCC